MNRHMIIQNPQWQGSGITDEIKSGAKTIGHYFFECIDIELELPEGINIDDLESLMIQLYNDFEVVGHGICECIANKDEQLLPIKNILKLIKGNAIRFNH